MRRLKRALGEDFREKSGFGGKLHRLNNQFFNNQSRKFSDFKDLAALLLGHWYEIMALYYVKSFLTEISASRQDRRVLQKSKIIRIEFLSKWGMLQTSRYV